VKNKYFTGQTCGETGTRTFWEHLVISGEILYLWGQYISIFIHLPNVNHPPNHPQMRFALSKPFAETTTIRIEMELPWYVFDRCVL